MQIENQNRALYEWIALRCASGEAGAFEGLVAAMGSPLLKRTMRDGFHSGCE
ncbi:MAG TPA: hypothetical protein VMQ56_17775 [Terracidiphilus sp.]|jgi:hypothetical protein|nr:hypothetical protein [Terracidiphilus sp.]